MLNLKSNKVNVLPVRKQKKAKRDSNTVVITETIYFVLPLGGKVLIPIESKTRRVSRETAKGLFAKRKFQFKTNWGQMV